MNKASKQAFIKEMNKNFAFYNAAYLIDMCGMTVAESSELRKLIRRNDSICKVVQNRLVKIAAQENAIQGMEQYLKGPLAMVFVNEDPSVVAKVLIDYSKRNKKLNLKGVLLEKRVYAYDNIIKLASLPSKNVLLQQFLGTLQSPVSRLLLVLTMATKSFLMLLKTVHQQKSEGKDIIGGTTMSSLSREDVINYILGLSVLELSQFIKEIEDKTGITAAAVMAPASVAAGPAAAVDAKPAEEEKTEFDVFLTGIGDKKINVIKVLRDLTNLGLKEAKELIDNVPRVVKEGISKEEADTMKKKFEEAGATVDIK